MPAPGCGEDRGAGTPQAVGATHQREDRVVSPDVPTRAERLRVNLFIFGVVREPPRKALEGTWDALALDEIDLFRAGDEEDLALSNACLEAEAALRDREWAALERLLGLVAAGEGPLDERVWCLPDWAFRSA